MNKKRYIPLVVVGALILSLIAVIPAFGADEVGFIDPNDINVDNNGSLSDDTPDDQEYGSQGGTAGLFLEDDNLNVPVRRVLIPAVDGTDTSATPDGVGDPLSYNAFVKAHSNEIVVAQDDQLKKDDYLMIGSYNVRKVTKVEDIPLPASTSSEWNIEVPRAAADPVTATSLGLPAVTYAAISANEPVEIIIAVTGTDDEGLAVTALPAGLELRYGTETTALSGTATAVTANSDGELMSITAHAPAALAAVTADEEYTVTITTTSTLATATDRTTIPAKTVKINLIDPKSTITLDERFAKDDSGVDGADTDTDPDGLSIYLLNDTVTGVRGWDDNYGLYAMAVSGAAGTDAVPNPFVSAVTGSQVTTTYLVADSGIARGISTPVTTEERLGSGTRNRRINQDDAIAVTDNGDGTVTNVTVSDIDGGDEIEVGTSSFILAWFIEPNQVEVSVRTQAYQTRTSVVLQETTDDSGEFALRIATVPFSDVDPQPDGTYNMPMVGAKMGDTTNPLPMFPVNERDVVTLSGSDSSATLIIETTVPNFTGLSPAHNFAESDSRPTIMAQVTDGDSGLKEGNIKILFFIKGDDVTNPTPVLVPEDDGDVDEIAGGFEISGRLASGNFDGDVEISWWIMATDNAGNVGYSDRVTTDDDGADPCMVMEDVTASGAELTVGDLAGMDCQPYVVLVDDTQPKLAAAETGRHWNTALRTGDSKDKTEYRVTKADASSVLAIFSEHLDATSVSASDFEVNGATPNDANVYNVTVRAAMDEDVTNYAGYDTGLDSVSSAGDKLGYVFLRLGSDLKANAEPKVELVGDVLDLAGNEQDAGTITSASDRIAPTLTVTIDEGSRPSTMGKVNVTITSDENIGSPTVEYAQVMSYDGDAMVTDNSEDGMGTVKFVSATEYTAVVSAGGKTDGLYTIHVKATDAAGGNVGMTGDMMGAVDASDDTKAILFELDEGIDAPDIDPDKDGIQDSFTTDDTSGYIRIDFSAEEREYDNAMYDHDMDDETDEIMGDDLDTHAGITIVSATLNGDDIADALQSNSAGNVFLYRAPAGLEVGEHTLEIIAMDDAGNRHVVAQEATIEITERKPFSLKLNPGWNLVSIPGEPADPDINVVIPADRTDITSVLAYDPTVPGLWLSASRGADGMFSGTLKNIVATRGYWIETNTFNALPVMIPKQSPGQARVLPTIPVAKGWNMVPILDVDGNFKLEDGNDDRDDSDKLPTTMTDGTRGYLDGLEGLRVYTFNTITNRWDLVDEVQIGKGYWVYVSKAGIIVP